MEISYGCTSNESYYNRVLGFVLELNLRRKRFDCRLAYAGDIMNPSISDHSRVVRFYKVYSIRVMDTH